MKKIVISFALIAGLMSATANVEAGLLNWFSYGKKTTAQQPTANVNAVPEKSNPETPEQRQLHDKKLTDDKPETHKLRNTAIAMTTLAAIAGATYAAAHGYAGECMKNVCAKAAAFLAPKLVIAKEFAAPYVKQGVEYAKNKGTAGFNWLANKLAAARSSR